MEKVKLVLVNCRMCRKKLVKEWQHPTDFLGNKVQRYILCDSCENIDNVLLQLEFGD